MYCLTVYAHSSNTNETHTYVIRVKFPSSIVTIPPLCGYYKGEKLVFTDNQAVFTDTDSCSCFPLVITSELSHKSDGGTILYLERKNSLACRLFYISRTTQEYSEKNQWTVEEEPISELPLRLPENSIILLMNPDHILSLQSARISSKKTTFSDKVVQLPSVIIKKNISEEELKAASDNAILASMDINAIHTRITKATQEVSLYGQPS